MDINSAVGAPLTPLQDSQLRNAMTKSSVSGIINGLPQSNDYVLSPSLLNQISDSKAASSQVLRAYEAKLRDLDASPEPQSGSESVDYQTFVDELLNEKLGYGPAPVSASATALSDYTAEKVDSDNETRAFLDLMA